MGRHLKLFKRISVRKISLPMMEKPVGRARSVSAEKRLDIFLDNLRYHDAESRFKEIMAGGSRG